MSQRIYCLYNCIAFFQIFHKNNFLVGTNYVTAEAATGTHLYYTRTFFSKIEEKHFHNMLTLWIKKYCPTRN